MIKVKWDLEEAIALYDVYLKSKQKLDVDEKNLKNLSNVLKKRAKIKGFKIDDKFRNLTGLSMQIRCIHFVVTNGKEGLSNASHIFYEANDLYRDKPDIFYKVLDEFYSKYE